MAHPHSLLSPAKLKSLILRDPYVCQVHGLPSNITENMLLDNNLLGTFKGIVKVDIKTRRRSRSKSNNNDESKSVKITFKTQSECQRAITFINSHRFENGLILKARQGQKQYCHDFVTSGKCTKQSNKCGAVHEWVTNPNNDIVTKQEIKQYQQRPYGYQQEQTERDSIAQTYADKLVCGQSPNQKQVPSYIPDDEIAPSSNRLPSEPSNTSIVSDEEMKEDPGQENQPCPKLFDRSYCINDVVTRKSPPDSPRNDDSKAYTLQEQEWLAEQPSDQTIRPSEESATEVNTMLFEKQGWRCPPCGSFNALSANVCSRRQSQPHPHSQLSPDKIGKIKVKNKLNCMIVGLPTNITEKVLRHKSWYGRYDGIVK